MNGLRNNFTELKYVVRTRKPDIFFLNETHLTENCDNNDLKVNNYSVLHCMSHSKHTGGVSVLINKRFKYSRVNMTKEQIAWYLSFEMYINKKPTIFAGVYLSSNGEHKTLVLDSFENWCNNIEINKDIVICGDFNIDMKSNSNFCRRLINICDDCGLSQLINEPTRITNETSTIIDLCLSNIHRIART